MFYCPYLVVRVLFFMICPPYDKISNWFYEQRLRQSENEVNGMRFEKGLPVRPERSDSPPPPDADDKDGGENSARDEEREREMEALVRKTLASAPLDAKLVVPQWPPAVYKPQGEQKRERERFRFQATLLAARETQLLADLERRNRLVSDLKGELSAAKGELDDKRYAQSTVHLHHCTSRISILDCLKYPNPIYSVSYF